MKMLSCREASHLVSESQERSLERLERRNLGLHLWICSNCRRFRRQIEFLRQALRMLGQRLETGTPGPSLHPDARDRIRRALLAAR